MEKTSSDVLIAGAGPTGVVLPLWWTRLGVTVRIIDKTAEPAGGERQWQRGPRQPEMDRHANRNAQDPADLIRPGERWRDRARQRAAPAASSPRGP